jgi:hypothetical protein
MPKETHSKLVVATVGSLGINTHTVKQPINTEVVVNVHTERTTTSEAKVRSGIIISSKRKLTTHENLSRPQTDCASMFKFICSKLPATQSGEGMLKFLRQPKEPYLCNART